MKVLLTLSDPWEMGDKLGWPEILADVVHRSFGAWLVEVIEPFRYAGDEYRFLVVSARFEDQSLDSISSESIPCNMIRTTAERIAGDDPCDVSWWRGGCAMIGSIAAVPENESGR